MRALLSTTLLLIASIAGAQTSGEWTMNRRTTTLSGGMQLGFPVSDFKASWGRSMFGLSANIAMPMRRLPLEFGYDFAWARMGSETQVPASTGGLFGGPSGPKVEVSSNVYDHLGLIRVNPVDGRIRPYGDFLFGVRHFVTRSTAYTANEATASEKSGDITGSYGWAVGAMVGLTNNIYAELRFERLYTGKVDYVDARSISIANDGSVTYQKLNSNVDVINVQLGVGFRF